MSASFETLQNDVAGYLNADPYFVDIPVLDVAKGVVESDVEQALKVFNSKASKVGTCVLVFMPSAKAPHANVSPPKLDLQIEVRVFESPLINRADGGCGKTAEAICAKIAALLHHWSAGIGVLYCDSNFMAPVVEKSPELAGYSLFFSTPILLDGVTKVAQPRITNATGSITMTCATGGASIYYTTDGTFPDTDATLYSAPFSTPASGTLIRAVAHKASTSPSNLTQITT